MKFQATEETLGFDNRVLRGQEPITWVSMGEDQWQADYTPQQMAQMGVFGDSYWADDLGTTCAISLLTSGVQDFAQLISPATSDIGDHKSIRGKQCRDVNYHGVPASLLRNWWLDKGLIYDYDPLGWYEWYWWYSLGRRIPEYDAWQIERQRKFVARHTTMSEVSPGNRQALLHWGARWPGL